MLPPDGMMKKFELARKEKIARLEKEFVDSMMNGHGRMGDEVFSENCRTETRARSLASRAVLPLFTQTGVRPSKSR